MSFEIETYVTPQQAHALVALVRAKKAINIDVRFPGDKPIRLQLREIS